MVFLIDLITSLIRGVVRVYEYNNIYNCVVKVRVPLSAFRD